MQISKLKDNIKIAIARIIKDMINADGEIQLSELSALSRLKQKYKLNNAHFFGSSSVSLADAINAVVSVDPLDESGESGIENSSSITLWPDWCTSAKRSCCDRSCAIGREASTGNSNEHISDNSFSISEFIDDMTDLAKVDDVVVHGEAMIILALRYCADFKGGRVFSYNQKSLRFAKKEVIYIENEYDKSINFEIKEYQDNINSVFGLYGFQFIWMPQIQEDFRSLSENEKRMLIDYIYPEQKAKTISDTLFSSLITPNTSIFSRQIIGEGTGTCDFGPSLLFKISTSIVNNNGFRKVDNFLQVEVKPGYKIQTTIQNFIRKYAPLITEPMPARINKQDNTFDLHGFHKTYLDFHYALTKEPEDITIIIPEKGKQRFLIGGVEISDCSKNTLIYYLLIYYFNRVKGTSFKVRPPHCTDPKQFNRMKSCEFASSCEIGDFCDIQTAYFMLLKDKFNVAQDTRPKESATRNSIKDGITAASNLENPSYYLINDSLSPNTKGYVLAFHQPIYIIYKGEKYDFIQWFDDLLRRKPNILKRFNLIPPE